MKAACSVAFLLFVSMTAQAAPGVDLVVLVDRSTSMSGDALLANLLLRMTLDLVARNTARYQLDHRLAVISFGSSATVDLPFTVVRQRDLAALRRTLEMRPAVNRGDTDVLAAFVAADELLRALPPDSERRRAVVLLTDGVPYVRGADMTAYRARLEQFVAARYADVSIDVLLAGAPRDPTMWQGLARSVRAAPRAADAILAEAHDIIARLVGTRTVESATAKEGAAVDTLVVPPYLDVVVFDVFRANPDTHVTIYPPHSATPIRGGVAGVEALGVGDVLATLVVPRPSPGEWTIRRSRGDARVRILSQQFFPRGVLVQPQAADELRQHDRVALAYRILDLNERPFRELRDYALAVEITVAKPNGETEILAMRREAALGPAVFRSTDDTECDLPGRYWTDVRITTTDVHGRPLEVFRDRWSGFSVTPATRVDCRVTTSSSGWLPVMARLDCASGEQPVELSAIATGSPAALFRARLRRDGRLTDPDLDLHSLGRGAFRGRMCGTWGNGAYELDFTADRSLLRAPYNIRFLPARLTFVRRTPVEWLALASAAATTAFAWIFLRRRKTRS